MARTGTSVSATTTAANVAVTGPVTYALHIKCQSGSSVAVRINIPNLHGDDYGLPIQPGESQVYRCTMGIEEFNHKTDSGTGTFDWEVVEGRAE